MLNRPLLKVRWLRLLVALACPLAAGDAAAQLRLPQAQLPQVPLQDRLDGNVLREPGRRLLQRADIVDLRSLRLNQVGELLQRHRDALEADPRGEPVVRHEILAWSPSEAGIAAARSAGLIVVNDGGDDAVTVLRVPDGADTAAMLERLRAADPDDVYDFNHIYTGSASAPEPQAPAAPREDRNAAPAGKPGAIRVGLVDGGVARGHEVFRQAAIVPWGCDGASHPNPHGTAVAALMIGRSSASRFRGVAPDATLYAADIYCDSATGGSASRIAGALAWLTREQVPVVNISLVGPPNRILEQVVKRMVQRGHLLVAAVGNDGPAAPPLYPASYPGVVGVTGVDAKGRPLPEAARGPQVMFAAPGNQMVSAALGAPPYRAVRGTSFASPIVATLLAGALDRPGADAARQALATVAKTASGVAAGTVSNETGYGVIGAAFRTDPSAFR